MLGGAESAAMKPKPASRQIHTYHTAAHNTWHQGTAEKAKDDSNSLSCAILRHTLHGGKVHVSACGKGL
jgi:hypothetical protein